MRTEEDLRAVFRTIADEVDDSEFDVTSRPTPRRRLRRVVLPLAVAAGVAAIVAAGAVVGSGRLTQPPPVAASPQPPVFTGDAALTDLPPGATPAENVVSRGGTQSLVVQVPTGADGDALLCSITVGSGRPPVGAFTTIKQTTVGSQPARIGRGSPEGSSQEQDQQQIRVRWQPAPDRWADAKCPGETGDVPIARRLGASLRLGTTPFRVPWTAASLPDGLAVLQVVRQASTSGAPRLWVVLGTDVGSSYRAGDVAKAAVFVDLQSRSDYVESNGGNGSYQGERQPDLGGRQVWLAPRSAARLETFLTIVDGDHILTLTSEELSGEQALEVAKSITLAVDLGDEQTWGPLADLPW